MPQPSFMRITEDASDLRFVNPMAIAQIYQTSNDKESNVSTVELISGSKISLKGMPEELATKFSGSDDSCPIVGFAT